jgi:DNA-binding FrmR family transcriptional regulator
MTRTRDVARHYHYTNEKDAELSRIKRIQGQAKGIERMIEHDRYCIEIVQQLSALSSAADELGLILLQHHIEGCVADAIREQHGEDYIE